MADLVSNTRWRPGDRFTLLGRTWTLDAPEGDLTRHFVQDYQFVTRWWASSGREHVVITTECLDGSMHLRRLEAAS